MLTLSPRSRKPQFVPVTIADGVTVRFQITPPSYERIVGLWMADDATESVLIRLGIVTDWLDVFTEREGEDGGREALPFSRDALAELLRVYPDTLEALLTLVNPYFAAPTGDEAKNSDAPQSAAT